MKSDFNNWTLEEFQALPSRKWDEEVECHSIVILPTEEIHDSNFRCMDFVAIKDGEPLCRLSGCSDVIHIDGIGGYGKWRWKGGFPESIPPKGWSIDCLKVSGLLRIFSQGMLKNRAGIIKF
jgi:hypothetical protein